MQSFIAQCLTTILGIVIGVQVALGMERSRHRRQIAAERRDLEDHIACTFERVRGNLEVMRSYFSTTNYLFCPPTVSFDSVALEFAVPRLYAVAADYRKCRVVENLRHQMAAWNRIAEIMAMHFSPLGTQGGAEKVYATLQDNAERCYQDAQTAFNEAVKEFPKKDPLASPGGQKGGNSIR
jgi:hypothetical protein